MSSTNSVRRPRRWLWRSVKAVGLIIALGSVAVNVILYREWVDLYRSRSKVELDPVGLKANLFPPDRPANAPTTDPVCLFFGDSRARQWPAPNVPGYRFVNRGVGGQTTEQIRARFQAHVAALSPKVVVLEAGINDLKAIPLLPERRDEIVADCKRNLAWLVEQSRALGATVILVTVLPPGDVPIQRRPIWSPAVEQAVEEVNAHLQSLAGERVIVLDGWALLHDGSRLQPGVGEDTLHLNEKGYAILNQALADTLARIR